MQFLKPEVSLFAENFYEMLSRDFGSAIFETLLSQSQSKGKKRSRDSETEDRDSKKRSTEEAEKKDEEMKVLQFYWNFSYKSARNRILRTESS